jgi:D-alanine-D-alanine ligase
MARIVILYGGKSGEHEVSLLSAASIVRHLDARHEAILIGIEASGSWRLQPAGAAREARAGSGPLRIEAGPLVLASPSGGPAAGLVADRGGRLEPIPCDCVFPVLHGSFGEDGTVQGLLEVADLPYVGAPVMGSALGMDKEKAKRLWMAAGLPVVPFIAVRRADLEREGGLDRLARETASRFGFPAFAKPACGGSSVGASKIHDAEDLRRALSEALAWDDKALIEPFVQAREIECSVLGNGSPQAFPPGEIVPSHEFYDYEAKYIDPDGALLVLPAELPPGRAERVMDMAVEAYRCLDLAGMARVDFFLDRATGEILLNEVNTIPGFTSISMYPKMCETGGLAYGALVSRLVELALARHEERARLRFSLGT